MIGLGLTGVCVPLQTSGPDRAIRSLFSSGEQGAWYDPSDMSTLFQDAAGTTPVTAVEQPVGLMLDKRSILGAELLTNGDFSNGTTGWTIAAGGTASVAAGVIRLTSASGRATASQTLTTVVGQQYRIDLGTISNGNAGIGAAVVRITSTNSYGGTFVSSANYLSSTGFLFFTATTTTTYIWLAENSAINGNYVDFGGLSVKSDNGNHAYQSGATTLRPTLSARYNLLTYTEQFDNAVWTKGGTTISATRVTDPLGGTAAQQFFETATTDRHIMFATQTAAGTHAMSCAVKSNGRQYAIVSIASGPGDVNTFSAIFDLQNGTITATRASGTATYSSGSITALGNGWYRCTITGACSSGSTLVFPVIAISNVSNFDGVGGAYPQYAGDITKGIYIWGASLVPADQASLPYQRVAAATDYDTSPVFKPYIYFDGQDDSWVTNSIDFSTVTSDGLTRRNLLTYPTAFDDAAWGKENTSYTANTVTNPIDGSVTADLVYPSTSGAYRRVYQVATPNWSSASVFSFYAKQAGFRYAGMFNTTGNAPGVTYDLQTGVATVHTAGITATMSLISDGWYRCTFASTAGYTSIYPCDAPNSSTATASGTNGIYIWGAQLETGSTATAFQNIGTDKMTVLAGVRKLSDAATAFVAELSATSASNNGTFALRAPEDVSPYSFSFYSKGTTLQGALVSNAAYPAPTTRVLTGQGDISGDSAILRVNGTQVASSTADQGTGNYGNYQMYIGRRGGTTLPFKGNLYSLVVRAAESTTAQVQAAESYVAQKTGVTF